MTINLGYRKVQVGEVVMVSAGCLDDFIRILVENDYICEIEKVDHEHWQISIFNKVNPNER